MFEDLEMFPDERADWNAAHIIQVLAGTDRPLMEFLLPYGDRPPIEKPKQTLEDQTRMLNDWCNGANVIHRESTRH